MKSWRLFAHCLCGSGIRWRTWCDLHDHLRCCSVAGRCQDRL